MKHPVVWWEINAQDGEALAAFYRAVFDWELPLDAAAGIWEQAASGRPGEIGGGIFTGKGALPPHRCLYIAVGDIGAVCARARAQGREILQGPFAVAGIGRLAFFRDPEGHMLGLIEREGLSDGAG